MYLTHDEWQATVARLITRARLVVVTLGDSAGTMWELAEAMRVLPPQRLLLTVPRMSPEQYQAIRTRNIEDLRDVPAQKRNTTWTGGIVPSLPDKSALARSPSTTEGLIHFSTDWQPSYVTLPPRSSMSAAVGYSLGTDLRKALRSALTQLSAHERHTGRYCG